MAEAAAAKGGDRLFESGRNCWRIAQADRAALIVDACDYYRHAREALLEARSQILLIGWDVDTRIPLVPKEEAGGEPNCLGPLLSWLSRERPRLQIHILAWDEGMISLPGRGTTLLRMLDWLRNPRMTFKFDSSHPLDASHHQKILIVDDLVAFCGGIDITAERWDTREHKDADPGRARPFTGRAYEPWHDTIMAVDGDAARALGELGRLRWKTATGDELPAPRETRDIWPSSLAPDFAGVPVAIARTRGHEGDISEVREIEALFVDMIGWAKRFVYFETQYFASRVVAEAIAKRLDEPDGPEIVVVNPETAEGWLDEAVMSPARAQLVRALKERDRHGRFRIYTPVTEKGADIYVHSKATIVDDRLLRVGSANLNNRSMGLDSECDVTIDARDDEAAAATIARLRTDLVAEHLAVEPAVLAERFAREGSLIGAIEALRGKPRTLLPFEPPELSAAQEALARSEWLDPEGPDELFERRARPGLLAGLGGRRRR